jgi:hypothetical protein
LGDAVAGGAEHQRAAGVHEAQHVDHRQLALARRDQHRLIVDVDVGRALVGGGQAQRVHLVALGQRLDRRRQGGREQERAAGRRRQVEQGLDVLAEAEVEHLVGLVEHHRRDLAERHVAAVDVIAQAAGGADHDVRTLAQEHGLAPRIHAADARDHPRPGRSVEPLELAADLERELAGRRDHQRAHRSGGEPLGLAQERLGQRQPERDGLARAGLRRHQEVAVAGLGVEDGGLDRGGSRVAALGQRALEAGMGRREGHAAQ